MDVKSRKQISDIGTDSHTEYSYERRTREQTPTQRALGLLTRREHSRKELTRKLAVRGVEKDEAAATVDKLAQAGWQDDARFAESLARARANTGYGPLHIRAELAAHGLDAETIRAALEACECDWADTARRLIARRFPGGRRQDPKQRRKAIDFLLRRGFERSVAFAVASSTGAIAEDDGFDPAD